MKLDLIAWQDREATLVQMCLIRRPYRRAVWEWRDRLSNWSRPVPWFLNTVALGWAVRPSRIAMQPASVRHRLILQELLR